MTALVVDASVAAKWWFLEPYADEAKSLRAAGLDLLSPRFLQVELVNIVVQKGRRGEVDELASNLIVAAITRIPVLLVPDEELFTSAHSLACTYHPSTYDCLYVALALRERCPVVTADRRFHDAFADRIPGSMLWIGDIPAFVEQATSGEPPR